MKHIVLLFLKKRWYLIILLGFGICLMNVVLWNETSQLLRNLPALNALHEKKSDRIYEVIYTPLGDSEGRMKRYKQEEITEIQNWFITSFFQITEHDALLYTNKAYFLTGRVSNKTDLIPMTEDALVSVIGTEEIDSVSLNDLLVFDLSKREVSSIEKKAKKINFPVKLLSLKETFDTEFNYYLNNFMFGIAFSLVFGSFSLFMVYMIISTSMKLFAREIRVLYIMGVPKDKLIILFILLSTVPMLIGIMGFAVFVQTTGMGFIGYDYVYLLCVNLLLIFLSIKVTKHKLGVMLDA
ncbi:hypothetical protein GYN67_09685 [Lactococcus piscium]|uniref:hypothetical protein n=1 Tax=Pseudolactococcus carnosus TaxID=2749961 RepID=UPI001FB9DE96|nr:hypothetical protein [Lactococcus carnosus]MCJ1996961.1 hypothetical protein [Lactococcus carnosus]